MPTTKKKSAESSVEVSEKESAVGKPRSKFISAFAGKMKPVSKSVKKNERPVIDLPRETQEQFVRFAATKNLFDIFEDRKKEQTGCLYSSIFEKFVDQLWISKKQPQNPSIVVETNNKVDAKGQFIVQVGSKVKINMPPVEDEQTPDMAMIDALEEMGVQRKNAEALIEREVSFVPQWSLNFTEILHGITVSGKFQDATDRQVAVGEALFSAIKGMSEDGDCLDAKERIALLRKFSVEDWQLISDNIDSHTSYVPQLLSGGDFLDRVCDYADFREELDAILTMFRPVHFCQRVKFAVSDTDENRQKRLIAEAISAITGEENNGEIELSYVDRS